MSPKAEASCIAVAGGDGPLGARVFHPVFFVIDGTFGRLVDIDDIDGDLGLAVKEHVGAAQFIKTQRLNFQRDDVIDAKVLANLFRRLVAEGSMTASFIPVFTGYMREKSQKDVWDFANRLFWTLALVAAVITILGMVHSSSYHVPNCKPCHVWAYTKTESPIPKSTRKMAIRPKSDFTSRDLVSSALNTNVNARMKLRHVNTHQ